jgi:hypothetical protein
MGEITPHNAKNSQSRGHADYRKGTPNRNHSNTLHRAPGQGASRRSTESSILFATSELIFCKPGIITEYWRALKGLLSGLGIAWGMAKGKIWA